MLAEGRSGANQLEIVARAVHICNCHSMRPLLIPASTGVLVSTYDTARTPINKLKARTRRMITGSTLGLMRLLGSCPIPHGGPFFLQS